MRILLVSLFLCLFSCTDQQLDQPVAISFFCSPIDSLGTKMALYLQMSDYKTKLAELGACDTIREAQYAHFQIPDGISLALGRSDSLIGQYIYWHQQQDTTILYRADADQLPIAWKELAWITDGELIPR